MTWIVYGIYGGGLWRPSLSGVWETWRHLVRAHRQKERAGYQFFRSFFFPHLTLLIACVYAVPAIGGFVVVAKMLWEYGNCQLID